MVITICPGELYFFEMGMRRTITGKTIFVRKFLLFYHFRTLIENYLDFWLNINAEVVRTAFALYLSRGRS